ncbi:MAG: phosphonate metabolism transcriptional regulator PhnF [Alphaproteobacteria bacterium]|nr:phosphonate metabolism transcriptional regulator PhnF [Alphaproteobacteria bacterium]
MTGRAELSAKSHGGGTIARGTGIAIWRQIASDLEAGIAGGRFGAGQQLPTEMELATRYKVNRHTVRRALAELASAGFVEATRGRGTFVSQKSIAYPLTSRTRFSEIVSAQELQPGGRLIASGEEPAAGLLAERLGLAEGAQTIRLETLRVAEGRPIVVATGWFPAHLVPDIIQDYAESGSITAALARAGFADYRREASWISAVPLDPADRGHLRLDGDQPVLLVESVNVTADGTPLQFSRSRFVGAAVQIVVKT